MRDIKLTYDLLNSDWCSKFVQTNETGGIVVFIGSVRNDTSSRKVLKLEFEAYESMALKELNKIADEAEEKYGLVSIAIHHRLGTLEVGELPVVVAVSAKHRKAAFDACAEIMDELKLRAPIWKKEFFESGEVWVSAHP